jgi:hypothetical protein
MCPGHETNHERPYEKQSDRYLLAGSERPSMTMYDRSEPTDPAVTLDTDTACSWIAHPDEAGQRASHAVQTDEGVWVLDPLDAPGTEELIDGLGDVVGIAVLSSYHARDAGTFARRYDVPVWIPEWLDRVGERVDAPLERYTLAPGEGDQGFRTLPCRPFPGWQEVFLYHEPTETLVVADSLGTVPFALVGDERLGLSVFRRLQPPTQLSGLQPERILVGHGSPVTKNATDALETVLADARGTFPDALRENGADSLQAMLGAVL